jgi:hypothetical protein
MGSMRSSSACVVLLAALVLTACASPSASPSVDAPSAVASASAGGDPSLEPSATHAPSVAATAGPSAPVTGVLPVPGFAIVNADAVTVRQEPGLAGEPVVDASNCIDNPNPCERPWRVGTANGYVWLYLLDGPVNADGYEWYLAATEMNTAQNSSTWPEAVGWVAAGDAEDAWLVVDEERSCPSEPIELGDVTNLAMTKLELLHCFGDRELTLSGWLPDLPVSEGERARDMAACREQLPWLMCGSLYDLLRREESDVYGDADYVDFAVDPASDLVLPARGQFVTVSGRFDHPDAQACGDVGRVAICRFTFVLTSVEPA